MLNRELALGFDAGVTYGATTSRVSANVGRTFGGRLRMDYLKSRGMDPASGILPEDMVKVQYGLQF